MPGFFFSLFIDFPDAAEDKLSELPFWPPVAFQVWDANLQARRDDAAGFPVIADTL